MNVQERTAWSRPVCIGLLLALGGCATQQNIAEQTDPLRAQIGNVEQTTASLWRANQEQAAAVQAREKALSGTIQTLQAQLKAMEARMAQLAERSTHAELRLDELATLNRDGAEQIDVLNEKAVKIELRADELATLTRDSEEQLAALDESRAKMELRLDEAMTLAREALQPAVEEKAP
jgi:DNA repair ATPase RecN